MSVTPDQKSDDMPIPEGPSASRILLWRELPQILRMLNTEHWSHEALRQHLENKYGQPFKVSTKVFRERLRRVLVAAKDHNQGQPSLILLQASQQPGPNHDGKRQSDTDNREAKQQAGQSEQPRRQSWEEKRAGRFPGSGTTVVHRSKPNRNELY